MPSIRREDVVTPEEYAVGGKPSKGTPADQRLAANRAKGAPKQPTPGPARGGPGPKQTSVSRGPTFPGKPGGKASPAARRGMA